MVQQSQKILSKQTWRRLAWSVRIKGRGQQIVVLSGSEQEILKLCPRDSEDIVKKYIDGFFYLIFLIRIDSKRVENQQICPLSVCETEKWWVK